MGNLAREFTNLPNLVTMGRVLLVPFVLMFIDNFSPLRSFIASLLYVVAAAGDGLDGYLARSRNAITTFGKLMDPIADKLLIIAALVSLVSLDRVEAWVAMVIIAREFAVTALRMAATSQGVVISASFFGKLKTCFQIAMVMALILADSALWVDLLVYATVAVTVASGADYFFGLRRTLGARDRAAAAAERGRAEGA